MTFKLINRGHWSISRHSIIMLELGTDLYLAQFTVLCRSILTLAKLSSLRAASPYSCSLRESTTTSIPGAVLSDRNACKNVCAQAATQRVRHQFRTLYSIILMLTCISDASYDTGELVLITLRVNICIAVRKNRIMYTWVDSVFRGLPVGLDEG